MISAKKVKDAAKSLGADLCGIAPMDRFEGALPEPAIRSWLDNLESAVELVSARQLISEDPAAAEQSLRDLLAKSPDNAAVAITLGQLLVDQNRSK